MTNFYTADWHLFHEGIIRMCHRPFASVEAMNDAIISAARARVTAKDDLWILGDLAFAKGEEARDAVRALLLQVPGRKHFVAGNHDRGGQQVMSWIRDLPWHSMHDQVEIKDEGRRVVLNHYPLITWPGARHGAIQMFGHVHDNWAGHRNSVNVGVDLWDFRPVTLAEVAERGATLPVLPAFLECEPGLEGEGHWA
ncbi:hypothetical protein ACEUZ9_001087 [Paracoccus litorisediminis]|uniref:metallophosphoesterase n=1 Tax=Paracoccus litorisediminis TaxID=2006130 RepID=UPI00372F28C5